MILETNISWEPFPTAMLTAIHRRHRCTAAFELELELIQTQMAQKPMLRAEVRMRACSANKASAE